ncbi:uncharacterized protein LOC120083942 [Benincasa hispida]|uniref:uncharacterized protein LOC120083942 n=1 Tax=Benincasa hispida TaxID=102211 RepID=UPI0019026C62|nr:uncharacterized protein LOC120083942 [Benincasa hispida]
MELLVAVDDRELLTWYVEASLVKSYQTTTDTLPFEALYGKSCKSLVCQGEVGESKLLGPKLVQTTNEAIQKIRARMQPTQSRQKSYADVRRKDLEFEIGDKVLLRVARIMRYVTDPFYVVDFEPLQLNDNLSYEEKPVEFLAREVKTLRPREIALVKVLWKITSSRRPLKSERMR